MKKLDLVGKKFGYLMVIEEADVTPAGHLKFKCKCDCGNIAVRTGTSIIRSKFSSCGCYKPPSGSNSPHWQGVGEISAGWFHNKIIRAANGSKGNRKIKEVDVDIEYMWELFLKQNKRCALSGLELTFPKNGTTFELSKSTASVDRIDSNKGYIKGNVQFVHKDINLMKNVLNIEYFIEMCKLIAKHQ